MISTQILISSIIVISLAQGPDLNSKPSKPEPVKTTVPKVSTPSAAKKPSPSAPVAAKKPSPPVAVKKPSSKPVVKNEPKPAEQSEEEESEAGLDPEEDESEKKPCLTKRLWNAFWEGFKYIFKPISTLSNMLGITSRQNIHEHLGKVGLKKNTLK